MDKKTEIENYEKNLKISYESARKDLDIILSNIIPNQKNLMKTYLWLNVTIIGSILAVISRFSDNSFVLAFLVLSFFFSAFSYIEILISLKKGQFKAFGRTHIKTMEGIDDKDDYAHCIGLFRACEVTVSAIRENELIVSARARHISRALSFTILSSVFFFISIVVIMNMSYLMRGGEKMASESSKPTTASQPGGQQPVAKIQTNSAGHGQKTTQPQGEAKNSSKK